MASRLPRLLRIAGKGSFVLAVRRLIPFVFRLFAVRPWTRLDSFSPDSSSTRPSLSRYIHIGPRASKDPCFNVKRLRNGDNIG